MCIEILCISQIHSFEYDPQTLSNKTICAHREKRPQRQRKKTERNRGKTFPLKRCAEQNERNKFRLLLRKVNVSHLSFNSHSAQYMSIVCSNGWTVIIKWNSVEISCWVHYSRKVCQFSSLRVLEVMSKGHKKKCISKRINSLGFVTEWNALMQYVQLHSVKVSRWICFYLGVGNYLLYERY